MSIQNDRTVRFCAFQGMVPMADSPAVADGNPVAVSAPPVQSRAVTRTTPSGVPAPAPGAGVPGAPRPAGGAPADVAAPRRLGRLRRFVLPVVALAAIGFAGKFAYDYYVEGRFLVSTDDAYVGANTAIIAAKASGHLMQVPVVDNQIVHQGDLIALIDDGDYRIAVDARRRKWTRRTRRSPGSAGRSTLRARSSPKPRLAGRRLAARKSAPPRPKSSAPRSNTTARTSLPRPISAPSSGSSRPPPIATAPPPRWPPPRRAPLRRSPRSRARRPISMCSRRSATRPPASATN